MKKWIYRILLIVCLGVFGYSAYNLWDIYSQKQQVETETKQLEEKVVKTKKEDKEIKNVLQPDWTKLKEQNANIIGWLYVPDCEISFPVLQAKDNQYYLSLNDLYNWFVIQDQNAKVYVDYGKHTIDRKSVV